MVSLVGNFCTTASSRRLPWHTLRAARRRAALRKVASARRLLSADDAKIMTLDDLFPHGPTPRTAAAGRESKLPLDFTAHDYNMEETGY